MNTSESQLGDDRILEIVFINKAAKLLLRQNDDDSEKLKQATHRLDFTSKESHNLKTSIMSIAKDRIASSLLSKVFTY